MRLGIITYDTRHLKTEQVALGLNMVGGVELHFFALPFVARAAREILFAHRPDMMTGAPAAEVAKAVGAPFTTIGGVGDIDPAACDLFLIGGAGLLPADWVAATRGRVINSHPGIIPLVRGLDAFKWAILDMQPIGNSLHFIDEEADAGEVFAQQPTPIFADDTLERFAMRHYDLEIAMMINFQILLDRHARDPVVVDMSQARPARMRMKAEQQATLAEAFERYKTHFVKG